VSVLALLACMAIFDVRRTQAYDALIIITALLALILFRNRQPDELNTSRTNWNMAAYTIGTWLLLLAILLVLGYATKTSSFFSRKTIFTWLIVTPVSIIFLQTLIEQLASRAARSGVNSRKVVIAGANELGMSIAAKIRNQPRFAMSLVGFFDDRSANRLGDLNQNEMLGNLVELPNYVRRNRVDLIFIALPIRNVQRVTDLLDELHDTTASIYFAPDVFVFDLIQCRTGDLDGLPVVALCETPFNGYQGMVKRMFDVVVSAAILLLISPLLILIALAIKLTSSGSIIFKQRRYGLDGQEFVVFKFRSMTVSEDHGEIRQATKNDSRVTRVGAFLRKYSLDELPQFFNVMQGRMSIVGPRPHAVAHNEEYRRLIKGYMVRHKVRPGITGLAQVRGYRGETVSVDDMRKRVESDLDYLRNWSIGLDVRIILRTVGLMLSDDSAY
jgi:putative colanic acid biosynthesis UDP-glucose lipid carrier transferase